MYDPKFTALEKDGMAYPIQERHDTKNPGVYPSANIMFYYTQPTEENIEQYKISNATDFSNILSIFLI